MYKQILGITYDTQEGIKYETRCIRITIFEIKICIT